MQKRILCVEEPSLLVPLEPHWYWLNTIHDSRKSFYRKAKVYTTGHYKVLYSYKKIVAFIAFLDDCKTPQKIAIRNSYSMTTLRHIKEFLLQEGISDWKDKKTLLKKYHETDTDFWNEVIRDFPTL